MKQCDHSTNNIAVAKVTVARLASFILIGMSLLTYAIAIQAQEQAQPKLQTVTLKIGANSLETEIANTPDQRYMGLSFRKRLNENQAMLFVYGSEQNLVFTMRNTLLPLSIAYISKDFIINEIHHMPVGPDQYFPAKKPAQYALEVNQGWFERNNVKVGAQIKME